MSSDQSASLGRRRRTTITPIRNNTAREVTFTKRRQGLFRKAGELAVLCGAEVAIVTYSPHENPFTFGTPSTDAVLDRFLGYSAAGSGSVWMQNALVSQEREALSRLGDAKKMLRAAGPGSDQRWWEVDPVEGLGLEELEHYLGSMERLKDAVTRRLEEMTTLPTPAATPSSGGSSNAPGPEWFDMGEFESLFNSVKKEEEVVIIPGSTSSEVVDDYMTFFNSIDTEEELVPRGNMFGFESFDDSLNCNLWDHDLGLYEIEQR